MVVVYDVATDHALADDYGCIAFDIDGTLAARDATGRYAPLEGVVDTLEALRARGTKVVFMSNNPISDSDYAQRLEAIGIYTGREEIITPIDGLEHFIGERTDTQVYAVGMDDRTKGYVRGFSDIVNDGAEYVVVGWHPAFFDGGNEAERDAQYTSAAMQLAQGARLVITSDEADVPIEGGSIPGTHSMVTAILDNVERLYGTDARDRSERGIVNVGKPDDISYQVLEGIADGERVLMVGDSLNTDILGAVRNGMDAALTLTGNAARYRDDADALDADLSSYGINERPHLLRTVDELVR